MLKSVSPNLILAAILSCAVGSSFGQSTTQQPRTGDRTKQTPTSPQTTPDRTDRDTTKPATGSQATGPLAQLIEMNAAEVEVGKLAAKKAQNKQVKDFAEMMVKDHTDALMKLRSGPAQSSANVKPNAKHQATADRLAKLSGAEFDREYMDAMVMDHGEAVSFLEKQSGKKPGSSTSSSAAGAHDLGKTAQDLLPTVRRHLEMAQQIQKDLQSRPATTDKKSGGK